MTTIKTTTETKTEIPTVTNSQIRALRLEAGEHLDFDLARLCGAALDGDEGARRKCVAAINAARAQHDTIASDPDRPSALDVEVMLRTMSRGATWRAVREHGATLSHGDWDTLGDDQRDWARASLGRIAEYENHIEIEPVTGDDESRR